MDRKTRNTLKKARALLAKRGGWTKGAFARNSHGEECAYVSDDAASFCLLGALRRVGDPTSYSKAVSVLTGAHGGRSLLFFNDESHDKRRVIRLFDKALGEVSR